MSKNHLKHVRDKPKTLLSLNELILEMGVETAWSQHSLYPGLKSDLYLLYNQAKSALDSSRLAREQRDTKFDLAGMQNYFGEHHEIN